MFVSLRWEPKPHFIGACVCVWWQYITVQNQALQFRSNVFITIQGSIAPEGVTICVGLIISRWLLPFELGLIYPKLDHKPLLWKVLLWVLHLHWFYNNNHRSLSQYIFFSFIKCVAGSSTAMNNAIKEPPIKPKCLLCSQLNPISHSDILQRTGPSFILNVGSNIVVMPPRSPCNQERYSWENILPSDSLTMMSDISTNFSGLFEFGQFFLVIVVNYCILS